MSPVELERLLASNKALAAIVNETLPDMGRWLKDSVEINAVFLESAPPDSDTIREAWAAWTAEVRKMEGAASSQPEPSAST